MILVTGGTGLVGSHLLFALLQKGENVTATYRTEESLTKTLTIFSTYGDSKLFDKILWVQADVSDYFALKSIFDNINYVYHCAAVVSFDRRVADKMFEINIEGTKNLINLSLEHKINKFCYASSVAALGNYTDKKCSDLNGK